MTATTITRQDVLDVAPEFAAIPAEDRTWTVYLADAGRQVNADSWGDLATRGAALLCAHMLSLERAAASDMTAGLASVTVGPVTKTFMAGAGAEHELQRTRYGREHRRLMLAIAPRWAVV